MQSQLVSCSNGSWRIMHESKETWHFFIFTRFSHLLKCKWENDDGFMQTEKSKLHMQYKQKKGLIGVRGIMEAMCVMYLWHCGILTIKSVTVFFFVCLFVRLFFLPYTCNIEVIIAMLFILAIQPNVWINSCFNKAVLFTGIFLFIIKSMLFFSVIFSDKVYILV